MPRGDLWLFAVFPLEICLVPTLTAARKRVFRLAPARASVFAFHDSRRCVAGLVFGA
jgi:hypothetical protein